MPWPGDTGCRGPRTGPSIIYFSLFDLIQSQFSVTAEETLYPFHLSGNRCLYLERSLSLQFSAFTIMSRFSFVRYFATREAARNPLVIACTNKDTQLKCFLLGHVGTT